MLTVISPAKKLNTDRRVEAPLTTPQFGSQTEQLIKVARYLSVADLMKLMKISEKLGALNAERFADFENQKAGAAVMMFAGDTYTGLDASSLSEDALRYGQDNLRILSGLYGLLRPLDEMRPYRLEMGSRLSTPSGKNLYEFWGTRLAEVLTEQARVTGAEYLLNCASQEYFGAVDRKALGLKVITPTFLEDKPGGPKIVSFHAKKARGALARFVLERRITDPQDLRGWESAGYIWQKDQSTETAPVFLRPDS